MPIWGSPVVAGAIEQGYKGPQHCDEPWPYQFTPGQQVLVHLRGEGTKSIWVPGRVLQPTTSKRYESSKVNLQYYLVSYTDDRTRKTKSKEYSPQYGDVKPDTPYVRELISEEQSWPIDDPDRYFSPVIMQGYKL